MKHREASGSLTLQWDHTFGAVALQRRPASAAVEGAGPRENINKIIDRPDLFCPSQQPRQRAAANDLIYNQLKASRKLICGFMNESAAFPWKRRPRGLNANSYAMIFLALLSIFFLFPCAYVVSVHTNPFRPESLPVRTPPPSGLLSSGRSASSRQPPNVIVEPVVSEAPLTQRRPRSLFSPHRGHQGGWVAPPPACLDSGVISCDKKNDGSRTDVTLAGINTTAATITRVRCDVGGDVCFR